MNPDMDVHPKTLNHRKILRETKWRSTFHIYLARGRFTPFKLRHW